MANKSSYQQSNLTTRPTEKEHQFSAPNEWSAQQVAARALYSYIQVNGAHLKVNARELRCLWKKGITNEQMYIDNLMYEYSSHMRSRSFNLLNQQYANRIMPSASVQKARVRFKCLA